jgi:hypothetical protein
MDQYQKPDMSSGHVEQLLRILTEMTIFGDT